MPVAERVTAYAARPEGSVSKLNTFSDGWRIFRTIFTLFRVEQPLWFFGGVAVLLALAALIFAVPLLATYLETGLVPRFPTAILARSEEHTSELQSLMRNSYSHFCLYK